ncbi:hypothetical protein COCSUDRAFT_34261 [Coccomyxa subellipsoidea C-169]|uniref:Uncharacterized protein n=1 Tax=Coccomyxa subellipsoidea (strain C-169) TaxID=574566 RepID=I0YLM5_COCSC|nr:hypothetical protein COCSUDRAFT_34261 [Coccomyxa subellipsoidea C-169]EIE19294.1 hypothetical protein COCSUDRAFT_34261 [Coccomyxa subellipsoidea C-169]|eukprot:XP_005643838.1 hypothetical protein COCSUDRAFT_34261 [Coccomyxa subellipsoidea C-169]
MRLISEILDSKHLRPESRRKPRRAFGAKQLCLLVETHCQGRWDGMACPIRRSV